MKKKSFLIPLAKENESQSNAISFSIHKKKQLKKSSFCLILLCIHSSTAFEWNSSYVTTATNQLAIEFVFFF